MASLFGQKHVVFAKGLTIAAAWMVTWCCFWVLTERWDTPTYIQWTKQSAADVPDAHYTNDDANLTLEDICITVKTSQQFHATRLDLILKTWHKYASDKVYYITDHEDMKYRLDLGNRLMTSKCGTSHGRADLCCKLGEEYDTFMNLPGKRWWCRFDDDQYVNVGRLVQFLQQFDCNELVYIGRRSVPHFEIRYHGAVLTYQFGTGGAGVCVSRALAKRLSPWCRSGAFAKTCGNVGIADDCVLGFLVTALLRVNLTESFLFHSHFEKLNTISASSFSEQISLSYRGDNVLDVPNARFNVSYDPTRILSLHCYIHPDDEIC